MIMGALKLPLSKPTEILTVSLHYRHRERERKRKRQIHRDRAKDSNATLLAARTQHG